MEEKKSLTQLVVETISFTALCYPVYSGLYSAVSSDVTFMEKIKDLKTAVFVGGAGITYFIVSGAVELAKRYQTFKRQ